MWRATACSRSPSVSSWAVLAAVCLGGLGSPGPWAAGLLLSDRAAAGQHAAALLRGSLSRASTESSSSWEPCAEEGELIGRGGHIRFGWGTAWLEAEVPRGAACSIVTFGSDPSPGVRKGCECASDDGGADASSVDGGDTEEVEDMGTMWSRCAYEGAACSCSSGVVRYGQADRWVSTHQAGGGSVACTAATFGGVDPSAGREKECWCEQPDAGPPAARVAIVMLTRHPPDLKTWLQYHLDYMGVERVFMEVEDTPHFNDSWATLSQNQKDRVTVWRAPPSPSADKRPTDDYSTLQSRQLAAMSRAKVECRAAGIDWLIHTDDDELLYTPVQRPVGAVLAAMPPGFDQAYMPNVEAVYKSADVKNCFAETVHANANRYKFLSYANGKAAIRVANDEAIPAGPHQWKLRSGGQVAGLGLSNEPFGSPLYVVHFESCPFERWEDKYWELGNTSPEKVQAIPFRFYRESIQRMQHCRGLAEPSPQATVTLAAGQLDTATCSQESLRHFWSSWKTDSNSAYQAVDLLPITIPWAKIRTLSL